MTGCFKKITAALTLAVYLFSGQGYAFEPARIPTLSDGEHARRLAQAPVLLPAEFGTLEAFIPSAQPSGNLPAILHLQTAHGDSDAQEALVRLLNFLHTAHSPQLFFLEGAAGELDPALDRFFTEGVWNESLGRFRMKKGRMSGAAFFLMSHPDAAVSAYGMESAEAYRNNREQFLKLLQERPRAEAFLEQAAQEIDSYFMRQASKELADFRRSRRAFEEHQRDLLGWALQLKKLALERLGLDLEHVSAQKDWPALLRLFWLEQASSSGGGKLPEGFSKWQEDSHESHYGQLRLELEERMRQEQQPFLPQSSDLKTLKTRVLQNELRAGDLWQEMNRLSALLMQNMATTPEEKQLLQTDENFSLLKSLVLAELSAEEYDRVMKKKDALRPAVLFQDLAESGSEWAGLEALFEDALKFYQGAKDRESFMAEQILEQSRRQNAGPVAVVVTGGFHAEGLRRELTRRGFAYLQMTPAQAQRAEGFTVPVEDPHARYRQIFMEHSRTAGAHIEDAVVLPVPRKGLERLGVSVPDFTASRMEAAEEWLRADFQGDRAEAVRQFNQSRFAQSFGVQLTGRRSEVRGQTAQFPSELSHDIREASRVIRRLFARLPQDARVSEFARARALLAALYGGTVQVWVERHIKESRWERQDYTFERGLLAYDVPLDSRLPQLRAEAEEYLLQMGIRPFQELVQAPGRTISIGEVLTHEIKYQNPFLHTFLGGTRRDGSRSPVYSRYEKARDFSDAFPLRQPVTDEEWDALRQFDTVFIPAVSMEASDPFVVRVQHNRVRGPYKGGIRMVRADTLRHDAHFMNLVGELKDQLTLEEMRFFLRKYILEETLPLAFGMTSKTAVAGIAYGGGKGTMLAADFYREENGTLVIKNNGENQGGSELYRQRLARNFARVLQQSGIAHEERDIPAADLNSGPYMDIMADEHLEALLEQLERRDHLQHAENALEHSAQRIRSKIHGSGSAEDIAVLRGFLEDRRLIADLRKVRTSQFNADSLKDAKYLEVLTAYLRKLQSSKRPVPEWIRPLVRATAVYTSKKESLSGSVFRPESTGYGGIHVVKEVVRVEMPDRNSQRPLEGLSAKLMGFGAVGAPAAEKMLAEGVLLKMISLGPQGGIVKETGLTTEDLSTLKKLFGQTGGFSLLGTTGYEIAGARYVEPAQVDEQLLVLDADMFVLAAVENAIHEGNVGKANGKIFVELANGGITNKAFEQLLSAGALVIPDTLANAGGVIVSYFEWQQNLNNERWSREKVIREMEKLLSRGVEQTHAMRKRLMTDWRTAADAVMATEVFIKMRQRKTNDQKRRSEIREIVSPIQVNLAMRFFLASLGYNTPYHLPSVPDVYEDGGGLLDVPLEEFLGLLNEPVQRGEIMQMHVANVFHAISRSRVERLVTHHFHGKTIGLVGFGLQTREFARRLNLLREISGVEFTILATSPELERRDTEIVRLADDLRVLYPGTQAVLAQSDTLSFDDQYAEAPERIKIEQMPKAQVLLNLSGQPLLAMQDWRKFFQKPGTLYFSQMDFNAADDAVRDTLMLRLFHPSQAIVLPQLPAAETRNGDDGARRSEVRSLNPVELGQEMIRNFQDVFGAMNPALYQAQVLPGFPDGITVNLYPAGELRGLLEKTDLSAELDLIQVPYGSLGQIKVSLIQVNGAPAFFIETIHPSHAYRKVMAEQPDLLKHHTDWQDRLVSRVLEISHRMNGIPVYAKSPALAQIQNPEMGHGRARRYYHLLFRNAFRKEQVQWKNYFYTDQEVEQITRSEKEIYGKERHYAGGEHELWRYDAHAWVNTSTKDPHPLPLRLFRLTAQKLQGVIQRTPLLELTEAGRSTQKKVFLKNESGQVGRAFKYRGVYAEVLEAIESVLNEPDGGRSRLEQGVKIVTQSTGNHGIALIYATADIIRGLRQHADSRLTALLNTIEPVVFTLKNLPEIKYTEMQRALEYYRQVTGTEAGAIRNEFKDYAGALAAREAYIAENASSRFYMEHGGKMIMLGHGSAGLEIVEQLHEAGITDDQKVVVLLPVGAGGPVGIGAAAKEARPNTQVVLVQSNRRDAFVRSLKSGTLEKNSENIPPTVILQKDGAAHPVIFPDGIDVDAPEPYGLEMARIYADAAVAVDELAAFNRAGPALVHELNGHGETIAGGTTALTLQALLDWGTQLEVIRDADVVVLFGTEGNVDPVVTTYLQLQANLAPGIFAHYQKQFERRSEVRTGAISPEEVTRARVIEFFRLRDQLLNLFSQLKTARQTAGTDVAYYFRQARSHVLALDAFIQEIRSADAGESEILQSYAALPADRLKDEAVSLGTAIQALTPLFIEQYRRYNAAGKMKNTAAKEAANRELDRLNREVVKLAKRRLKIQLLRLRTALSSEPIHQGTVFTLLISITDLYQRIAHEYFWRSFRQGAPVPSRILTVDPFGSVSDNLAYETPAVFRVEQAEEGKIKITQIVWKWMRVENGPDALTPVLTAMEFDDPGEAYRGKKHALDSQQMDHAVLTQHDHALQSVADVLRWYVSTSEPLDEELREQLLETIEDVLTGPGGKYGLRLKKARTAREGTRVRAQDALPMPREKLELAQTHIRANELKQAMEAINAAQEWTRARRRDIEKSTVPATLRKRNYAYFLMRDAQILSFLTQVREELLQPAQTAREAGSLQAVAQEKAARLEELYQTFFRFVVPENPQQPEVRLYRKLQSQLRLHLSSLRAIASAFERNQLASARSTAAGLNQRVSELMNELSRIQEERKIELRSEVRASGLPAEDETLAIKIAQTYNRERILAARSLAGGFDGDIGGGRDLLQHVKSLGVDVSEDAVRVHEILSAALEIQQDTQRRSEVRGKPSKKEKRKEEKRRQKEEAGLRWYQRWFLRFEQKLPEKVAGLNRRTFLAATAGTAGLFLAGWSAKTYLTPVKPWEALPSGEGYSFTERQSAVRQALLDAVDWMIENHYPAPDILKQYRSALEEAQESPENNTWFLGKVAEGDHFENRYVMITTERMWRLMGAIKAAGSSDMYVEYLAALIVREAWGYKMLHELSERFPAFAAKVNKLGSGFNRLRQNIKEGPFFFAVEETAVIDAAAEGIIYEFYETLRHREALQWFEQRSLYSKEKIQEQYENLKGLVDRETYARATTVRRLTGRLQDERAGLFEILKAELAHHLPRGFSRIGQDMTFTALGIYAVMETVRWGLTRGEDGISTATLQAGPQLLDNPEYLERYHLAAERLYLPVAQLIEEIETTIPAGERIVHQLMDDHEAKELPTIQQAVEDFTKENPGALRSEVRAKKTSASKGKGFGEKTVLAEIAAIQADLEMSDLGGRDRDEFSEYLRAAEETMKRKDLELLMRMHSASASLTQAAVTIQSVHTKTIDAIHKRVTALRKKIDTQYPVSPGEASKPGPKPKKRSEVRISPATLAVAQLLDGLFLPEDLAQVSVWPEAQPYLTAPSWKTDLDIAAQEAAASIHANAASGSWQERFPGDVLRGRDKQAYLIGPELVRRYGPVLFALEQAVSNTSRMIVVAASEEEALQLKPLVDAVNAQLVKSRQVMIKTPAQARALLKADTLRGLGLEGVDAALLRQLIPDFLPLNGFELDRWIDQAPGLTALVQKFRALAALAAAA